LPTHPGILESGFADLGAANPVASAADGLPDTPWVCPELLRLFGRVGDGRSEQGRVHPVAVVLSLCAAAVVAGMRSFTAVAGWVADVPAGLLAQLYGRRSEAPSKATIWRVVTGADAEAVDAVIGVWLAGRAAADAEPDGGEPDTVPEPAGPVAGGRDGGGAVELVAIAVDGKTVRGAVDTAGNQTHLLAAATHREALVLGQVEVGAKSNEIPMFAPLLDRLAETGVDLSRAVITADAMHAQRSHARYLHERGAGYVLTVKQNQPTLFAALDALPWAQTPITHRDLDTGHGRRTTRTIQVLPAPAELPFPHAAQAWLVERYVTDPDGTPISAAAALGVTNLEPDRAGPALLAELVRGQWGIESLHWLRDTVWREDHSTAHTRAGPRVMAALRNLAVGAIRLGGRRDITETTRWATRDMDRPFKILQLTT
jgi:predicted transposase YbfD/YdcC